MTVENKKRKYSSVSLQLGILRQIDSLIKELAFWPSRGAFVREACLEKIRKEQMRLRKNLNHKGSQPEKN